MDLADQIRALRNARKMSQAELAAAIGVPQTTISAWERGLIDIKVIHLCKVARVFKVDAGELTATVCAQLPDETAA